MQLFLTVKSDSRIAIAEVLDELQCILRYSDEDNETGDLHSTDGELAEYNFDILGEETIDKSEFEKILKEVIDGEDASDH